MSTIIKQSAGIDCGSEELVVSLNQMFASGDLVCVGTKSFANSHSGFDKLLKWISKISAPDIKCRYVVEATGIYHERLAYFLFEQDQEISIILPNKINAYGKTCSSKQQDDYQASKVIAEFGCVKKLEIWQPPSPVYRSLKQLSRERDQLQKEHSAISTQLHAEVNQAFPYLESIKRMKARIKLIEKQIEDIENEVGELVNENKELKERVLNVCTIPGVGVQTVITIVAETNGFNLIRNYKQLVSYAGYDVIQKKSGTSVRGKARISKKGNTHIRKALHFPAFSAVRYNQPLKKLHERIMERQDVKMKGYVAVQRKLLVLIYTLWKKNEPYKLLEQPVEAALTELD